MTAPKPQNEKCPLCKEPADFKETAKGCYQFFNHSCERLEAAKIYRGMVPSENPVLERFWRKHYGI